MLSFREYLAEADETKPESTNKPETEKDDDDDKDHEEKKDDSDSGSIGGATSNMKTHNPISGIRNSIHGALNKFNMKSHASSNGFDLARSIRRATSNPFKR